MIRSARASRRRCSAARFDALQAIDEGVRAPGHAGESLAASASQPAARRSIRQRYLHVAWSMLLADSAARTRRVPPLCQPSRNEGVLQRLAVLSLNAVLLSWPSPGE